MDKLKNRKHFNEKGLTLIEVLISLVILAIVLLIILFVLLQIIRTNKTSQEIVNATYIAQTEMEELYAASKNKPFDEWIEAIKQDNETYTYDESINESTKVHTISFSKELFSVKIKIAEINPAPLKRVIIYVLDQKDEDKQSAKMENIYSWEASQ